MKKILTFLAIAAMVFVACNKTPKPQPKPDPKPDDEQTPEEPEEPEYSAPITIDGDFADWAKLDATKVAVAKTDPDSPWDAVNEIRVDADEVYVFF